MLAAEGSRPLVSCFPTLEQTSCQYGLQTLCQYGPQTSCGHGSVAAMLVWLAGGALADGVGLRQIDWGFSPMVGPKRPLGSHRSRGEEPAILFSGGALLLVDDLARPDLVGGESVSTAGQRPELCLCQADILRGSDVRLKLRLDALDARKRGERGNLAARTEGPSRSATHPRPEPGG